MTAREPRAYTADELRGMFLDAIRREVSYWQRESRATTDEKVSGVAFSILVLLDGNSPQFPAAVNLIAHVDSGDKAYRQADGSNWVEDGTDFTGGDMLHDQFYVKDAVP